MDTRDNGFPGPESNQQKAMRGLQVYRIGPALVFSARPPMLTKLRALRKCSSRHALASRGELKEVTGYKSEESTGTRPEGVHGEPTFPLLIFSHGARGFKNSI